MNYLLGSGEKLTDNREKKTAGGDKNPPYNFAEAKRRMSEQLRNAVTRVQKLPDIACPDGKIVSSVTMHPRYISKSDFPSELFSTFGLRAVGGKSTQVTPDKWGVEKHPISAMSDTWFVSSTRESLIKWQESIGDLLDDGSAVSLELQSIEEYYYPRSKEKIKKSISKNEVYEAVLHSDGSDNIIDSFYRYAESIDVEVEKSRVKFTGGVIFVPLQLDSKNLSKISKFSFLRALRRMPELRIFRPPVLRTDPTRAPELPDGLVLDSQTRAAIFDGGLPDDSPMMPWVNYIEPTGIGPSLPDALEHGEAVTSAYLFGHLSPDLQPNIPHTQVDHIRVIDTTTIENDDYEMYDVLDRILTHLDSAETKYKFVNLSLGPAISVEDDEITRWTSELDERASQGNMLLAVAVGNTGERSHEDGLDRIQPPSDGVNFLAVGACDSLESNWNRCSYSSIGPGRTPGIAKPDGVAFGGSFDRPFGVINSSLSGGLNGTTGTSFASPNALRSGTGIHALIGTEINPLGIRALLVHNAETQADHKQEEIGWGRFIGDPLHQIVCADDEVAVIYQGKLPLKQYLRAPIPLPSRQLIGKVAIKATLVIAPEVDPAFSHAYTRAGLEVVFRPHSGKFKKTKKDGKLVTSIHADTDTFFSTSKLYGNAEYELRNDGHKWEPCVSVQKKKLGASLFEPCFDIYYHTRDEGRPDSEPEELAYALIVTVKAKKENRLYEEVSNLFSEILVPIEPSIDVPIKV